MSSTETYTLGDPTQHMAFQLGDTNPKPLAHMALVAGCKCGQQIATITGIGLDINVPEGQDLVARCRCGKEWSIFGQSQANLAKLKAMQESVDHAAAHAAAAPAEPAEPAPEVPSGEDPQSYNKSL